MYTLHVKADSTFDLYVDTALASSGSLLEDMKPPVVPEREIDDPEDEQPEDWVTEVRARFYKVVVVVAAAPTSWGCGSTRGWSERRRRREREGGRRGKGVPTERDEVGRNVGSVAYFSAATATAHIGRPNELKGFVRPT